MTLAELERRGRALAEFCARVRERGSRAVVEEDEDLPYLRAMYLLVRGSGKATAQRRERAA